MPLVVPAVRESLREAFFTRSAWILRAAQPLKHPHVHILFRIFLDVRNKRPQLHDE